MKQETKENHKRQILYAIRHFKESGGKFPISKTSIMIRTGLDWYTINRRIPELITDNKIRVVDRNGRSPLGNPCGRVELID